MSTVRMWSARTEPIAGGGLYPAASSVDGRFRFGGRELPHAAVCVGEVDDAVLVSTGQLLVKYDRVRVSCLVASIPGTTSTTNNMPFAGFRSIRFDLRGRRTRSNAG